MKRDWKAVYVENPWMPARLLQKKFGIKQYDIDNWRRSPERRRAVDPEQWQISETMSEAQLRRILQPAWQYYVHKQKEIAFETADAPSKLLRLKNLQGEGYGFLVDHLKLLKGYDKWVGRGYTRIAFALFNIYPGQEVLTEMGILPCMFFQTASAATARMDVLSLIEHVYIRHVRGIRNSDHGAILAAKREFCARWREPGFLRISSLREFGVSAGMLPHGLREALEAVARRFGDDLHGEDEVSANGWSSSEFRRRHPHLDLRVCRYCGGHPVDLHHLLSRRDYQHLTYERENVVPLCTQVHSKITRRYLTKEQKELYHLAMKDWHRAPVGSKTATFDVVMAALHADIYPDHFRPTVNS